MNKLPHTLLTLILTGVFTGFGLSGQPTDNPVASQYSNEGYPNWTDQIPWDNVLDVTTDSRLGTTTAVANDPAMGERNFAAFEMARDILYADGGGVLYFPAGEYTFSLPDMGYGEGIGPMSRGLMLKSGVVIRGADLTPVADEAVVRYANPSDVVPDLEPPTVFVFPTQVRGVDPLTDEPNSAGEVPTDWNFVGMTTGDEAETLADIDNIGVVNVTLRGGFIFWGYHTNRPDAIENGKWLSRHFKNDWPVPTDPEATTPYEETWAGHEPDGTHYMHAINGATGWHDPVYAGEGRLVMNVKIENGAPWNDMLFMDANAESELPAESFSHYRYTGRVSVHGSNVFVANNVLAKPTKNFVHKMLQRVRTGNASYEGPRMVNVLFDYANHIGIDINKSNYGGKQEAATVQTPGSGYYFENVIVRDNWVFNRGNKSFEISGMWVQIINNHAEKYPITPSYPRDYIVNDDVFPGTDGITDEGGAPFDGWTVGTGNNSADYMNRGYDLGGRSVWVHQNTVLNTGSIGNDGEGIMAQRHNNLETFGWAFTYNIQGRANKGYGTFGEPGWIGVYDMHSLGLLLFNNATPGTHGILSPQNNLVLDVTVSPNLGSGGTNDDLPTSNAIPADYQALHSDAVSAPANVTATWVPGKGAVEVAWEDTADNELGFRVERRANGGDWQVISYRPRQGAGPTSGVSLGSPYVEASYPQVNPTRWMDYSANIDQNPEYRLVAFNEQDDDTTGVSAPASVSIPDDGPAILEDMVMSITGGDDFELSFMSENGKTYQLQKSMDMSGGSWSDVGAPVVGDGTEKTMQDLDAMATEDKVFYRVVVN